MAIEPTATGSSGEPPWLGRVLGGRFRLEEELGAGGIAVVFRAQDVELSRSVAVKVLQPQGQGRAELRARFEREARVLAALSHPNIVSLVDYGVEDGRAYLVMELLRGLTLGELLDREGRLPPERAFHIVRQVARALAYAHGEGALHRDLKPDNVFLQSLPDTSDHVRLLDFGFAKLEHDTDRGAPLTQAGTVFGTPRYMAPEQLSGSVVDARADLYSLAVILYETLCGRRPFEGEVREVLKAKVVQEPPRLSAVAPELEVAAELDALLAKALAIRRDDRHPDAQAFLAALDAVPQPAVRPRIGAAKAPAPRPRTPWVAVALAAAGAGLVLVLVSTLVVWWAWPAPEEPAEEPALPPPPLVLEASGDRPPSLLSVPDPWDRQGELPFALASVRASLLRDEPVENTTFRTLREHASVHPDDALAQLLLGHVFTERGMRAMAVGAYERAAAIDPGARGDPRMLVNLVRMSMQPGVGTGPARVIRQVYGAEAIPVIDAAMGRPRVDAREARRLAALRASLER